MSFFIRDKNGKDKSKVTNKRKKIASKSAKPAPKKRKALDEDITSESESEQEYRDPNVEASSSSSDEDETAAEKRNRLAKLMLEQIKEKLSNEDEDVTSYLKNEILEKAGKLHHNVADQYLKPVESDVKFCTWSKLKVVTCVVVSSDNKLMFSGSKDGTIVKWSLPSCSKQQVIKRLNKKDSTTTTSTTSTTTTSKTSTTTSSTPQANSDVGHYDAILSLALTKDVKYLASGGKDKVIHIWDPSTLAHLHTFQGHRSSVMGLCFQQGTHQLFSSSKDKSIKLWNLDEMAYVETLFGHEDEVTSIDCLSQERAVSSGGRDGSVRFWKIPEESHLVFHGHSGCIDCVRLIDDHHFVSAADDNTLALWSTERKKPIFTVRNAHNNNDENNNNNIHVINNDDNDINNNDNIDNIHIINNDNNNDNNNNKHIHFINNDNNNNNIHISNNTLINGHHNDDDDKDDDDIDDKKYISEDRMDCTDKKDADVRDADNEDASNGNNFKMTNVEKSHKIILNNNPHEQWISSIATLKYSDLVASGSRDGQVRFWKVAPGFKSLERLFTLNLHGFINSLQFSDNGQYLVVGIGQEHRLGRWFRPMKNVKNSICLVQLKKQNGLKHKIET